MTIAEAPAAPGSDRRLRLGVLCFIAAWAVHLVTLAVVAAGASPATIAAVAAINFILNKVLLVVSAAILGKSGFNRLKQIVFGVAQRTILPDEVGPLRYGIGLILFVVPIVFAWMSPYLAEIAPAIGRHTVRDGLISDLVLLVSLFVLGGGFWEKLWALFVRKATVVFPV